MIPLRPFYLLRHGETVANAAGITAGGEFDTPLNDTGISQARMLRDLIHQLDEKPHRIYHSNMSRARDTATIVNEALGLDMHEHADLREHMVGEWSGRPWEETSEPLRGNVRPAGGENKDDFAERVRVVFNEILDNHPDELLLLVAHGGVFSSLGRLWGLPIHDIMNCHLHYFEPRPGDKVHSWRIWHFDAEEGKLIRRTSPHCPSATLMDNECA